MKILLLTDSLALPRDSPDLCRYVETWPSLLKKEGHSIHQVSIGGATSTDILRQSHYHRFFNPDLVILQVGIVDCAPRFVTKREKFILSKLPFGKHIISLMNNPLVRKWRGLTYVSKKNFKKNVIEIKQLFNNSKFLIVEITGGEGYEEDLPGIERNIFEYNEILAAIPDSKMVRFAANGLTMADHHHLNVNGHKTLFKELKKEIG